jgi:hypothetical protein
MQVAGAIKRMQANGGRIAGAVSDWKAPWARRRDRRLLWAVGFVLGLLAVAGVVLSVMRCQEAAVDDDE